MRAFVVSSIVLASSLGCAADGTQIEGEAESSASALDQASFSYVGQSVINALNASHGSYRHRTWNATTGNALDASWLLQTPPSQYWGAPLASYPIAKICDASSSYCDRDFLVRKCTTTADCIDGGVCTAVAATVNSKTGVARNLCVGHSDSRVDEVYKTIITAERFVDITTLTPADGRFTAAIRNALTVLHGKNKRIDVRVIVGNYPGANIDTTATLHELVRDLPSNSLLRVSVGAYRYNLDSWNHSKIIAVDGVQAIVGGMNLWTQHYLDKNPVHDVSIHVRGSAAVDGHLFANEIWDFNCNSWSFFGSTATTSFPGDTSNCPAKFTTTTPGTDVGPGVHVVSVGRLGKIGNLASDTAIVALMGAAKRTLYVSQQDIGPVTKDGVALDSWPAPILAAFTQALARGVDVYLVVSNANSVAGGLGSVSAGYSNGYTPQQTAQKIADYAYSHSSLFPAGTNLDQLLCSKLHVSTLRASADDTWPDGTPLANHAKTIIVDELAFYVGSQNLYPANLAEYGYIVDDAAATASYVAEHWSKEWQYSKRVAVSGTEATTCSIHR